MIKKPTGAIFTPHEFSHLHQCIRCGKADQIRIGTVCKKCEKENIKNCKMCEILLRNGKYVFYTYDIKEEFRTDGENNFKASKEMVREFEYEVEYDNPLNTDRLCTDCIDWKKYMKNRCRQCDRSFVNTKENYKKNGNYCGACPSSSKLTSQDESKETGNDLVAR